MTGSAFLPALSTFTDRWGPWYDGDSSHLYTDWHSTADSGAAACFDSRSRNIHRSWYTTSPSSGERFVRTTGTYEIGASD